ncbi:MAG: hypothetical protein V2A79_08365, partial [Planctomycetota bacterium]
MAALVAAAHWPALSAKAFAFDDSQYLTENPLVQNPSWSAAWRFLREVLEPSTVNGYYQPLSMISLMLDHALGGRADYLRPFHQTSLILHVVNTTLVIGLLYLLFRQPWVAAVIGLLFGLHPLTVEPVVWVGERKTVLATCFALGLLIAYAVYARRLQWRFYGACLVLFALALMSKPTTILLPGLLLLLDYWPLRRLSRRSVLEKVPFLVLMVISAVITVVSQSRTATTTMPDEYPPFRIPLMLCHNIVFYLYKIVWPVNLTSHYPIPDPLALSDGMVLAGVIGTCILIPALLISWRWTRALLVGWLCFFVAIFPTMGVIGFTNVIASDKFAYLPSVGLMLTLAWYLSRLWDRRSGSARRSSLFRRAEPDLRRVVLVLVGAGLALAEARATRHHLAHWRDTETLFASMIAHAPRAASLHWGQGYFLFDQGRYDEAVAEYSKA